MHLNRPGHTKRQLSKGKKSLLRNIFHFSVASRSVSNRIISTGHLLLSYYVI